MADPGEIHLTTLKGSKLYCTIEDANEDMIVVSLRYFNKEFCGILLDASKRQVRFYASLWINIQILYLKMCFVF